MAEDKVEIPDNLEDRLPEDKKQEIKQVNQSLENADESLEETGIGNPEIHLVDGSREKVVSNLQSNLKAISSRIEEGELNETKIDNLFRNISQRNQRINKESPSLQNDFKEVAEGNKDLETDGKVRKNLEDSFNNLRDADTVISSDFASQFVDNQFNSSTGKLQENIKQNVATGTEKTFSKTRNDERKQSQTKSKLQKNLNVLQNRDNASREEIIKAAEFIAGSDEFRGDRVGRKAGELASQLEEQTQDKNQPKEKNDRSEGLSKVEQAREFREKNPLVAAANPEMEEFLDNREKNLETRNEIDQKIKNLKEAPEGTQITIGQEEEAETVSKSEALDRLEDRRFSVDRAMEENERRLQEVQRRRRPDGNESEESEGVIDQGVDVVEGFFETGGEVATAGVDVAQDLTGTEGDIQTEEVEIPGTDLEVDLDNLAEGRADVRGEFEEFSRDVRDTGLKVMSEGQEVGDQFAEVFPNTNERTLRAAEDVTGVEQFDDAADVAGNLSDSVQSGVGTFGTQAAGFFTAGAGSFGMLAEDATQEPVETGQELAAGTAGFISMTGGQFSEDPLGFVAEEGGEEISEAAIGAAVAGPAGAAFGATPTPEVEPEFNPEIDPDATPITETEPEVETEQEPDALNAELEDLPSGFTQETAPEVEIQPVQENEVTEAGGLEVIREAEGRTVYPDQPGAESFNFEVEDGSAEARATPTEPDKVGNSADFRGENPETGFTEAEQEIIRTRRGREDVTIRQGETVPERGPGLNNPDPDQTVIEVEESETGGEFIFSSVVPLPPGTVEPEPETEVNPQPQPQGADPEISNIQPEVEVSEVGPEVEVEPETETEVIVEPETEVEPEVQPELEPVIDPAIDQEVDQGVDQEFKQSPRQEFQEEQVPEISQEQPQQQTTQEPEPEINPDKIMEPEFFPEQEPEVERRIEPEPEFRPESNPEGDFGSEDQASRNPFSEEDVDPRADPEFNPSLGAVLFDVTSEEAPADDQVFTGTEVRPIPEDLEEEFDLPF